jgi:hypothetical protein
LNPGQSLRDERAIGVDCGRGKGRRTALFRRPRWFRDEIIVAAGFGR